MTSWLLAVLGVRTLGGQLAVSGACRYQGMLWYAQNPQDQVLVFYFLPLPVLQVSRRRAGSPSMLLKPLSLLLDIKTIAYTLPLAGSDP